MVARTDDFWLTLRTNPKTGVDYSYKERSPDYVLPGERHDFWELLYVDKGFVKIRLGHRNYSVSQGEFVLIVPNQPHAVFPSATVAPFYITVHFQTNLHRLRDLTNAVNPGSEEGRHLLTKLLCEKASSAYGANVLARGYIAEFLVNAVRATVASQHAPKLPTYFRANSANQLVEKAIKFIKLNYSRPLALSEIAKASGVSRSHLEHLFKKKTESSIMTYLQVLRIQHAKTLLLESGFNISQIAEQTGYSSIHLFSRRFKTFMSVSPTQYAKMVRLGLPREMSRTPLLRPS